ncbi:MAG: hypothetical protein WBW81_16695 [Methylocella sp.]
MSDDDRVQNIRSIFLKDWDPLGVGDNQNLADEYDAYIPGILRLLDNHCTANQLERYLLDIEEKWELTPDAAASQAARKIFKTIQNRG